MKAIPATLTESSDTMTLSAFTLVDRAPDWLPFGLLAVFPDMKTMSGGSAREDEEAADR
jgi:hypothetical protein